MHRFSSFFQNFFFNSITECFLLTLSLLIFRNVNFYGDFFVFYISSSPELKSFCSFPSYFILHNTLKTHPYMSQMAIFHLSFV